MKITLLGDTYLDRPYPAKFEVENYILNLEFPITQNSTPAKNKVVLFQKNSFLKQSFGKYPIAVNLANNHIFDYGIIGFIDTINYLKKHNINFFGAGKRSKNFNNPFYFKFDNKIIAFSGFVSSDTHPIFEEKKGYGVARLELDTVLNHIVEVKQTCNFLVLFLHWGIEESVLPKPEDIVAARAFIDAGADLIIGHHAHVIQKYEKYNNKYIFYGLGNFIFPDLDILSFYDGKQFTRKYKKNMLKKHKCSVAVTLDENLKVDFFSLFFNGKEVIESKCYKIEKLKKIHENNAVFKAYLNYRKRKDMVARFLKSPKIPSIESLLRFWGLKK